MFRQLYIYYLDNITFLNYLYIYLFLFNLMVYFDNIHTHFQKNILIIFNIKIYYLFNYEQQFKIHHKVKMYVNCVHY